MEISTLLNENFSTLIATFGSLAGVLLGSVFTWIAQKKFFSRQMEWEQKKSEDVKLEELTKIYNSILKVDGEKEVVDYNQGRKHELRVEIYMEEVRPLLFERFHLLHSDIAKLVKEIDEILLKWSVIEDEGYEGEIEYVSGLYLNIIDKINKYLDSLRMNHDS